MWVGEWAAVRACVCCDDVGVLQGGGFMDMFGMMNGMMENMVSDAFVMCH